MEPTIRITQASSFPGSLDDAVIYSIMLTDGEVAWLAYSLD